MKDRDVFISHPIPRPRAGGIPFKGCRIYARHETPKGDTIRVPFASVREALDYAHAEVESGCPVVTVYDRGHRGDPRMTTWTIDDETVIRRAAS